MFHSRDSPRLLVCDTGLYMEQNDIGFITVAICGGYISVRIQYPCSLGSVNSDIQSSRDVLVSFRILVCVLLLLLL